MTHGAWKGPSFITGQRISEITFSPRSRLLDKKLTTFWGREIRDNRLASSRSSAMALPEACSTPPSGPTAAASSLRCLLHQWQRSLTKPFQTSRSASLCMHFSSMWGMAASGIEVESEGFSVPRSIDRPRTKRRMSFRSLHASSSFVFMRKFIF